MTVCKWARTAPLLAKHIYSENGLAYVECTFSPSLACHDCQDLHTLLPPAHREFMVQRDASKFYTFLHQSLGRPLSINTNYGGDH